MDKDEYYCRQAAHAFAQAEKSNREVDKLSWLRMAQRWIEIRNRSAELATTDAGDRKAQQAFADSADALHTHRPSSYEAH